MRRTKMKKHGVVILALALALPVALSTPAVAQVVIAPHALSPLTGPWIGVSVLNVTEDRVKDLKLKEEHGVEVVTVAPDGPGQKAGLKEHDVILEYNGTRLEGVDQFKRMLSETPVGRTVKLLISRDGATQTIGLKLEERSSNLRRRGDGNSWAFSMPAPTQPPSPPSPPRTPFAQIPNWNG